MRVWIDIDNPPQARYLLPFVPVFRELGADVWLTARDYGITTDLIKGAGEHADVVGSEFGRGRRRKVVGVVRRARTLAGMSRRKGRPVALLSSSRSAALAAWRLGIPSFAFCDYEFVELSLYRRLGTRIVFPAVIGPDAFRVQGFSDAQLVPFPGLKEDITFAADVTLSAPADPFAGVDRRLVRILVRPPHEDSHYFASKSLTLTEAVLAHLADAHDAQVILSPRHDGQRKYLESTRWRVSPVVIDRALDTLTMLQNVDGVVTAGGTMAREAAYLGVPAYSVFAGRLGGVDRHLTELGRLVLIDSEEAVSGLRVEPLAERAPMPRHPEIVGEIARLVLGGFA